MIEVTVVGGEHTGLICAGYLAGQGTDTLVVAAGDEFELSTRDLRSPFTRRLAPIGRHVAALRIGAS